MKKLNEMKETFTINHANNTIEMTKQFAKASGVYGSDAYKMLLKAKKQLPTYTVIVKETPNNKKPRDNYKGLTYDYMERYIKTKENNEELLKEFFELRGIGTNYDEIIRKASYVQVKKWFLTTFPEIDDYKKERKEAWEVIERKAKEQKKAKTKNAENRNEKATVNASAIMLETSNATIKPNEDLKEAA